MSRSYKHTPYCGMKKDRELKNYANRRIRRMKIEEDIPNYNSYKKMFPSWDICDWYFMPGSFNAYYKDEVNSYQHYQNIYPWYKKDKKTKEQIHQEYNRDYIRK